MNIFSMMYTIHDTV